MIGRVIVAPPVVERALIVEDNAPLRSAIARLVRGWGAVAVEAGTAREAKEGLRQPPDLVICDVSLPDGSGLSVFEAALSLRREPAKIAISGVATAEEAFHLAHLGVGEYLAKPFSLADLERAVRCVLRGAPDADAPDLDDLVRASVGQVPMRQLQKHVRNLMVEEALTLSSGSRRRAAQLLEVSRQAVQQIVRDSELGPNVDRRAQAPDED
jgi:DNA-binding response OmpR family regulator